jgi:hypothetical protein
MSAIDLIAGVGKVKNNSVWIHVALGALHISSMYHPPSTDEMGRRTIYIDHRIRLLSWDTLRLAVEFPLLLSPFHRDSRCRLYIRARCWDLVECLERELWPFELY